MCLMTQKATSICTETDLARLTLPPRTPRACHRQAFLDLADTGSGVHGSRDWGCRSRGDVASIVSHVCFDKVTRGKSTAEAEFPSQNACSHDARESSCVVAGICEVSPTDPKEIKHCALGFENRAAADGADFNAGHGHADLEVAIVASSR